MTRVYAPSRADIRERVTIAIDPTRVPTQQKGRSMAERLQDVLHRRAGYLLWRTLTLGLIGRVGCGDVAGLLIGGDAAYDSRAYDVLRLAPWSMRGYGAMLGVLVAFAAYGFGLHRAGRTVPMRAALTALACWYVFWVMAIAGSWVVYREVVAWGAIGKVFFVAFVAFTLARTTPATVPDREGASGVASPPRTGRHLRG